MYLSVPLAIGELFGETPIMGYNNCDVLIMIGQMLDWGASDFGTDLGRCHFIGAVQNEEESIKVGRGGEGEGHHYENQNHLIICYHI